mmetsp:Transcript_72686/g.199364  ORF Transcript_72686/g.199364 Transcript_72686/m.199364 type:complete len:276 (+) Transcript_72686:927-1754(+)
MSSSREPRRPAPRAPRPKPLRESSRSWSRQTPRRVSGYGFRPTPRLSSRCRKGLRRGSRCASGSRRRRPQRHRWACTSVSSAPHPADPHTRSPHTPELPPLLRSPPPPPPRAAQVNAHLLTAAGRSPEVSVYAYKRVKERFHAPTEAYKCAVLRHVKLNDGARPPMLEVLDRTGALQEAWAHPGFAQLSLAAFLYEIGARKKPQPWQVPKTIDEVVAKLETVGVPHTTSPTDFVHDATGINVRLRAAGKSILTRDTFDIARKLLSASSYVLDLDA